MLRNKFISKTHQRNRLQVLELDIGNPLESSRLVAYNQLHVPDLSNAGHEILQISRPAPGAQLHAKHGPRVALLRRQRQVRAGAAHVANMELRVDVARVSDGRDWSLEAAGPASGRRPKAGLHTPLS